MIAFWIDEYPKELQEDIMSIESLFGHNACLKVPRKKSWRIKYILDKNTRKHDFLEFNERQLD